MLKGLIKLKRGEYKAAEQCLLRSLELAGNFGDVRLRCNRYDNLVALYTTSNQIHRAIDFLKRSMELKEAQGDATALARSLLQMSSLLFSIEDFKDGRETLDKANSIISELDNAELKMQYHFAYATLLSQEKKYDEALSEFDNIISFADEIHDSFLASKAYYNQGELLKESERWAEAENKFTRALEISRQNHFVSQELMVCVQLATIALRQNNIDRCRVLYDYISGHKDMEDTVLREDLAEIEAKLYEAEGHPQKALDAYRSYMQSYKSHYDNEQSKVILFIKARYENEKRERELQESKLSKMESEMKRLTIENTLKETENRFKAWVENGTEMIVILRNDLNPTYVSPYIYKSFGYSRNFFKEVNIHDLIHPEDIQSVFEKLKFAKDNPGLAVHSQFRLPESSGEYRWIESTSTNLLHDETVRGIVCNLKDIIERKQSEVAIQELNRSLEIKIEERTAELQEAIKDLEAFSYSVSHDLRSPLRIISGYTRLLISDHEKEMSEEAQEFVNIILDNSKRMGQLIDDLLNFSRMGRKAISRSQTNHNSMIQSIISDFRREDTALTKNIIVHEIGPTSCDPALIKQVWINLISNAIKYSGKKADPIIEIGAIPRFNETVYYVKDNGAGFDMRFAKHLFTVFKRLHDRSDFDGMGVGLALAQRIIRMHDGRIWAEAEVDKGATFYFTLGTSE